MNLLDLVFRIKHHHGRGNAYFQAGFGRGWRNRYLSKLLIHQTIDICYSQSISMNLLFSEFPQVTPVFQEKQPLWSVILRASSRRNMWQPWELRLVLDSLGRTFFYLQKSCILAFKMPQPLGESGCEKPNLKAKIASKMLNFKSFSKTWV